MAALAVAGLRCEERELAIGIERLALPHGPSPYGVITVSIGVAALMPGEDGDEDGDENNGEDDNDNSGMLVRAADLALYRAKLAGRNRAMLPANSEGAAGPQALADAG